MKNKISRILGVVLTLALLSSMVMVAVPVSANPDANEWEVFTLPGALPGTDYFMDDGIASIGPIVQDIDGTMLYAYVFEGVGMLGAGEAVAGTSTWSTTKAVSGIRSALLSHTAASGSDLWVQFVPAAGTTIAELVALGSGWSFWYWLEDTDNDWGPMLELKFTDPDPTNAYFVDITVMAAQLEFGRPTGVWEQIVLADALENVGYWGLNESGAGIYNNGDNLSLTAALTALEAEDGGDLLQDWKLVSVKIQFTEAFDRDVYIDDVTIDGVLYELGPADLLYSDDVGRTWDETDYAGAAVVDIATSSLDADTLYVTDGAVVYRSDDAGDSFTEVATIALTTALDLLDGSEDGAVPNEITTVAVGYDAGGNAIVFVGTDDTTGATYGGGILFTVEGQYPQQWTSLDLDGYDGVDVLSLAVSPDFATSNEILAVVTDADVTDIVSNVGVVGDWTKWADIFNDVSTGATDVAFPDDFASANTVFVGIATGGAFADVYSVAEGDAAGFDFDVDDANHTDIVSLSLTGDTDTAKIAVGDRNAAKIFYSTDGGWNWVEPDLDKALTGVDTTYALLLVGGGILAATGGADCALSLSVDGSDIYNQISLINAAIDEINGVALSPDYATDGKIYLATLDGSISSLFRYDGDYWERILAESVAAVGNIDMLATSPDFATLFIADGAVIRLSDDAGESWENELRYDPDALYSWLILDVDTILAGGAGVVDKTNIQGSRPWDDNLIADVTGDVISFAVSGSTIVLGTDAGEVAISVDSGDSWYEVFDASETFDIAATHVATDGSYIYAAAGNKIWRCEIDATEDWDEQEWEDIGGTITGVATGAILSLDGTLYVADNFAASLTVGGMQRSLNPTADEVEDIEWETVTDAVLDDANATLGNLQLTIGSNVLWAVDGNVLYSFKDILTEKTSLSSPNHEEGLNTTEEATLVWAPMVDAKKYQVQVSTVSDFDTTILDNVGDPTDKTTLSVTKASTVDPWITPGVTYYWRVRATAPYLSRWSEPREFTTALEAVGYAAFWVPEPGAQNVAVDITFAWPAADDAVSYVVEVADNPAFTLPTEATSTANSVVCPIALDYSTTYYWRVKAIGPGSSSNWSLVGAFTTVAEPEPQIVIEPQPTPTIVIPAIEWPDLSGLIPDLSGLIPDIILPEIVLPDFVMPTPTVIVELPTPTVTIVESVLNVEEVAPAYIWAIVVIGGVLVIAVIVLIVRTRRIV